MKKILIEAKNIKKSFAIGKQESAVLNGVSVNIYSGDLTVIMGASGAGKSTLLYTLSGMESLTEGSVIYKGMELTALSEKEMAGLRAEEFGFVFQQAHLISNLTLEENILTPGYLAAKNKGRSEREVYSRAQELIRRMRLTDASDRLPAVASGGEQQRAAIARAVINRPSIVFADEPTGALNRKNSDEVLQLFTELNKTGQSILMVTHDIHAALRGNRILYLEDGMIIDELRFAPYHEEYLKEREESVNQWLKKLRW